MSPEQIALVLLTLSLIIAIAFLALALRAMVALTKAFFDGWILAFNHSVENMSREHTAILNSSDRTRHSVHNLHQAFLSAPEMLEPHLTDPGNMETKEPHRPK